MSQSKNIKTLRQLTSDLHGVVVSLQELSVLKMQDIREQVLETRKSMDQLLDIFIDIRYSQKQAAQKELDKRSNLPKPSQCFVFLSQNQKFSDSNVGHVWLEFVQEVATKSPESIVIVGAVGKELAKNHLTIQQQKQITYFDLPNRTNTENSLTKLLEHLQKYDHILAFYGQFQNLLTQIPATRELNGQDALLTAPEKTERAVRKFLIEPKLHQIITYFEQEVERGILQQILEESQLAHVGSRVQTLESSRHAIEESLGTLTKKMRRARRREQTKKQQQRLAGRHFWQ